MRLRAFRALAVPTLLVAGTVAGTGIAEAKNTNHLPLATVYDSDRCSADNNTRCFAMFYESSSTGMLASSCFITNRNISNHSGYYAGDGINVSYVFSYRNKQYGPLGYCASSLGDGNQLKNNAEGAANRLRSYRVRVFYNSGYSGPFNTWSPLQTKNFTSAIRNDNASNKLLS